MRQVARWLTPSCVAVTLLALGCQGLQQEVQEKRLEDLQRKTREQGRKLDELQKASEDAWETLKRGFESTWTEVQSAWKDTKANLS